MASAMCLSLSPTVCVASESCSITIYEKDHKGNGIAGSTLRISKVADREVSGQYTLSNGYENSKVNFNSLSDPDYEGKTASALSKITPVSSSSGMTEQSGMVKFGGLKKGLYLVTETAKSGNASSYSKVSPYFILAPDSSGKTDIVSYPKTERLTLNKPDNKNRTPADKKIKKQIKHEQIKRVKTGDSTQFISLLLIVLAALMGLIQVLRRKIS